MVPPRFVSSRWPLLGALPLLAVLAMLSGCAKHAVIANEPRVAMHDLAPGLTAPDNAYTLLTDTPTEGRFACALAVAKLTPRAASETVMLALQPTQPREQAFWTEQLRGVSAIRDVIFLSPVSIRPDGDGLDNLCASAERLGAALLLIYTPNGLGPNSAQVLGVMYDVHSRRPLATMHASALILDKHGEESSPNRLRGDHRNADARFQAQRSFEAQTFACLREISHRDTPPPTTQPHRWHQPLAERWWLRPRP